jgi:hypothetical protein
MKREEGTGRDMTGRGGRAGVAVLLAALGTWAASCGIFEPRPPEDPTQSSLNFRPATTPEIVITNLQNAIDQKSADNYLSCFSDPSKGLRPFVFVPSADASAQYPSVMLTWNYRQEDSYFRNLIAKTPPGAFSNLSLQLDKSIIGSDSVLYTFLYTLIFEHNDPGFPRTAKGTLQFTLSPDPSNIWYIHRWIDFQTESTISWSMFKGKFSN